LCGDPTPNGEIEEKQKARQKCTALGIEYSIESIVCQPEKGPFCPYLDTVARIPPFSSLSENQHSLLFRSFLPQKVNFFPPSKKSMGRVLLILGQQKGGKS